MREQWLWPPHCNSSSLNGTANPCRDRAVHAIVLPPCGKLSQQHVLTPTGQLFTIIMKKKNLPGERLTLPGDSSSLNVVVFLYRDRLYISTCKRGDGLQVYGEVKIWPLFFPCKSLLSHCWWPHAVKRQEAHCCGVKG